MIMSQRNRAMKMTIIKPTEYNENAKLDAGYFSNVPNDIYHSHNSVSKSGLDLVERDPYHFFNNKPRE